MSRKRDVDRMYEAEEMAKRAKREREKAQNDIYLRRGKLITKLMPELNKLKSDEAEEAFIQKRLSAEQPAAQKPAVPAPAKADMPKPASAGTPRPAGQQAANAAHPANAQTANRTVSNAGHPVQGQSVNRPNTVNQTSAQSANRQHDMTSEERKRSFVEEVMNSSYGR